MAMLPKLSGADLARSSWATCIEAYKDLPEIYKSIFDPILTDGGQAFPYTVLTPSYERFIHRQPEKLISDFGHEIFILERNGGALETKCYPLDGISYVEFRTALLASSFKICGMTNEGVHTSSTLIFNSVTDYLFNPFLKKARFGVDYSEKAPNSTELEKFDHLANVNFKFMNFAKHSLVDDEKVIDFILQPEIQEILLTFLGKTYFRTVSPTHMSILTDRELIVIQEDATRRKEDRYGAIWNYIPLKRILSLSVSEKTGDLVGLRILLPEDTIIELHFQTSVKKELDQLLNRSKELKH